MKNHQNIAVSPIEFSVLKLVKVMAIGLMGIAMLLIQSVLIG